MRLRSPTEVSALALALVVAINASGSAAFGQGEPASALEPASSGDIAVVDRALVKLSIHARMLVIGAHPDDEDNALLTWVSRGLGGEAAYLSVSRGDWRHVPEVVRGRAAGPPPSVGFEGTYVYTGLSFFRELPAGVPDAFRLFANLLGLGAR